MISWVWGLLKLGQDVIIFIGNKKAQRLDTETSDSGTVGGQPSLARLCEGYFKTKLDEAVWGAVRCRHEAWMDFNLPSLAHKQGTGSGAKH